MTDESDETELKRVVRDELDDQLSVGDLLSDESLAEQVDGEQLGQQVGRKLGALLGRRLGRLVGRLVSEKTTGGSSSAAESSKSSTQRREKLRTAVTTAAREASETSGFRSVVEEKLVEWEEERQTDETDSDADEADTDSETGEADTDSSADGIDTDSLDVSDAADLPPELSSDLRAEAYRDLLSKMSYRDLQSIAKDVGVKANLSRDEMADKLVEQFGENGDESES